MESLSVSPTRQYVAVCERPVMQSDRAVTDSRDKEDRKGASDANASQGAAGSARASITIFPVYAPAVELRGERREFRTPASSAEVAEKSAGSQFPEESFESHILPPRPHHPGRGLSVPGFRGVFLFAAFSSCGNYLVAYGESFDDEVDQKRGGRRGRKGAAGGRSRRDAHKRSGSKGPAPHTSAARPSSGGGGSSKRPDGTDQAGGVPDVAEAPRVLVLWRWATGKILGVGFPSAPVTALTMRPFRDDGMAGTGTGTGTTTVVGSGTGTDAGAGGHGPSGGGTGLDDGENTHVAPQSGDMSLADVVRQLFIATSGQRYLRSWRVGSDRSLRENSLLQSRKEASLVVIDHVWVFPAPRDGQAGQGPAGGGPIVPTLGSVGAVPPAGDGLGGNLWDAGGGGSHGNKRLPPREPRLVVLTSDADVLVFQPHDPTGAAGRGYSAASNQEKRGEGQTEAGAMVIRPTTYELQGTLKVVPPAAGSGQRSGDDAEEKETEQADASGPGGGRGGGGGGGPPASGREAAGGTEQRAGAIDRSAAAAAGLAEATEFRVQCLGAWKRGFFVGGTDGMLSVFIHGVGNVSLDDEDEDDEAEADERSGSRGLSLFRSKSKRRGVGFAQPGSSKHSPSSHHHRRRHGHSRASSDHPGGDDESLAQADFSHFKSFVLVRGATIEGASSSPTNSTLAIMASTGMWFFPLQSIDSADAIRDSSYPAHERGSHVGRIEDLCATTFLPVVASCGEDGSLRLWDMIEQSCEASFRCVGMSAPSSLAMHPSGHLLSAGFTDRLRVFNVTLASGNLQLWRENTSVKHIRSMRYSNDGGRLAVNAGLSVLILHAYTLTVLHQMSGHSSLVRQLRWSPDDSRLVSIAEDNGFFAWNPITGARLEDASVSLKGTGLGCCIAGGKGRHRWSIASAYAFANPRLSMLIMVHEGGAEDGAGEGDRRVEKFRTGGVWITALAVDEQEQRLFAGTVYGTIRVYALPLVSKTPVSDPTMAAAAAGGGEGGGRGRRSSRYGAGMADRPEASLTPMEALRRGLQDSPPFAEMQLHADAVTALAVSPDGRVLSSAGADGAVFLLAMPSVKISRNRAVAAAGEEARQLVWEPPSMRSYNARVALVGKEEVRNIMQRAQTLENEVEEVRAEAEDRLKMREREWQEDRTRLQEESDARLDAERQRADALEKKNEELWKMAERRKEESEIRQSRLLQSKENEYERRLTMEIERFDRLDEELTRVQEEHAEEEERWRVDHARQLQSMRERFEREEENLQAEIRSLRSHLADIERQHEEALKDTEEEWDAMLLQTEARGQSVLNQEQHRTMEQAELTRQLQKRLGTLKQKYEGAEDRAHTESERVTELQKTLRQQQEELASRARQLRAAEDALAEHHAEVSALKQEIQTLRNHRFVLEHQAEELVTSVRPLEEQRTYLARQAAGMQSELRKSAVVQKEKEQAEEQTRLQVASLQAEVRSLEKGLQDQLQEYRLLLRDVELVAAAPDDQTLAQAARLLHRKYMRRESLRNEVGIVALQTLERQPSESKTAPHFRQAQQQQQQQQTPTSRGIGSRPVPLGSSQSQRSGGRDLGSSQQKRFSTPGASSQRQASSFGAPRGGSGTAMVAWEEEQGHLQPVRPMHEETLTEAMKELRRQRDHVQKGSFLLEKKATLEHSLSRRKQKQAMEANGALLEECNRLRGELLSVQSEVRRLRDMVKHGGGGSSGPSGSSAAAGGSAAMSKRRSSAGISTAGATGGGNGGMTSPLSRSGGRGNNGGESGMTAPGGPHLQQQQQKSGTAARAGSPLQSLWTASAVSGTMGVAGSGGGGEGSTAESGGLGHGRRVGGSGQGTVRVPLHRGKRADAFGSRHPASMSTLSGGMMPGTLSSSTTELGGAGGRGKQGKWMQQSQDGKQQAAERSLFSAAGSSSLAAVSTANPSSQQGPPTPKDRRVVASAPTLPPMNVAGLKNQLSSTQEELRRHQEEMGLLHDSSHDSP